MVQDPKTNPNPNRDPNPNPHPNPNPNQVSGHLEQMVEEGRALLLPPVLRVDAALLLEALALAHLARLALPLPPPQRERVGRLAAKVGAISVPHQIRPHTPLQLQQTWELALDGDRLQHGGGQVGGRHG